MLKIRCPNFSMIGWQMRQRRQFKPWAASSVEAYIVALGPSLTGICQQGSKHIGIEGNAKQSLAVRPCI